MVISSRTVFLNCACTVFLNCAYICKSVQNYESSKMSKFYGLWILSEKIRIKTIFKKILEFRCSLFLQNIIFIFWGNFIKILFLGVYIASSPSSGWAIVNPFHCPTIEICPTESLAALRLVLAASQLDLAASRLVVRGILRSEGTG